MRKHLAIWVDQDEARVFEVHPHPLDQLKSRGVARVKRPRGGGSSNAASARGAGCRDDGASFHREVLSALDGTEEVLVLGPIAPKAALLRYMLAHHRPRAAEVVGFKPPTTPTDALLLAYARWHFRSRERRVGWE